MSLYDERMMLDESGDDKKEVVASSISRWEITACIYCISSDFDVSIEVFVENETIPEFFRSFILNVVKIFKCLPCTKYLRDQNEFCVTGLLSCSPAMLARDLECCIRRTLKSLYSVSFMSVMRSWLQLLSKTWIIFIKFVYYI